MKKHILQFLFIASTCVLTACGGGSGSSGGNDKSTIATSSDLNTPAGVAYMAPIAIQAANAGFYLSADSAELAARIASDTADPASCDELTTMPGSERDVFGTPIATDTLIARACEHTDSDGVMTRFDGELEYGENSSGDIIYLRTGSQHGNQHRFTLSGENDHVEYRSWMRGELHGCRQCDANPKLMMHQGFLSGEVAYKEKNNDEEPAFVFELGHSSSQKTLEFTVGYSSEVSVDGHLAIDASPQCRFSAKYHTRELSGIWTGPFMQGELKLKVNNKESYHVTYHENDDNYVTVNGETFTRAEIDALENQFHCRALIEPFNL